MLHNLASATVQVANLVNYMCHPQQNGNGACLERVVLKLMLLHNISKLQFQVHMYTETV